MDIIKLEDLEKRARRKMAIAGLLWTAGNVTLIFMGSLKGSPILAGCGIANTAASGAATIFPEKASSFSGPAFLVAGATFTEEHLRTGLQTGSSSDLIDSAFGAGVFAGISLIYYGQQLKKAAEKVRPFARLMGKFPGMTQGKLAQLTLAAAYAFEIGSGAIQLYHGIKLRDYLQVKNGLSSLGLIGLYSVGNKFAGNAADLRNQADRLKAVNRYADTAPA